MSEDNVKVVYNEQRNGAYPSVENHCSGQDSVIPAKAGIQYGVDLLEARYLDPGFRRGDESIFNTLLTVLNGQSGIADNLYPATP